MLKCWHEKIVKKQERETLSPLKIAVALQKLKSFIKATTKTGSELYEQKLPIFLVSFFRTFAYLHLASTAIDVNKYLDKPNFKYLSYFHLPLFPPLNISSLFSLLFLILFLTNKLHLKEYRKIAEV